MSLLKKGSHLISVVVREILGDTFGFLQKGVMMDVLLWGVNDNQLCHVRTIRSELRKTVLVTNIEK